MIRLFFSAVLIAVCGGNASAAELELRGPRSYSSAHRVADNCHIQRCGPARCVTFNICRCPDPYSCRGLYDAYGPYGGRAYMSAYTRYY